MGFRYYRFSLVPFQRVERELELVSQLGFSPILFRIQWATEKKQMTTEMMKLGGKIKKIGQKSLSIGQVPSFHLKTGLG